MATDGSEKGKVLKPPTRPPKGQRKPKAEGAVPAGAPVAEAAAAPAVAQAAPAAGQVLVATRPRIAPPERTGPVPGRTPSGELEDDRVLTWPDLVYTELLCMSVLTLVTLVICWLANAPLEEIANPNHTPNPSKAPWYFVGLQESLVYFDPWIAGVVLPTLIIVGLMAIPFVDRTPTRGSGYYNWADRKFAWVFFVTGFATWCVLIVIGNGLRGPGWAWYWPWEDKHHVKVVVEGQLHHPHFGDKGTSLGNFFDSLHFFGPKREEDGTAGRRGVCLPGIAMFLSYLGAMLLLPAKWSPTFFPELWRRRMRYLPLAAGGLGLCVLSRVVGGFGLPAVAANAAANAAAGLGIVLLLLPPLHLAAQRGFFPLMGRGQMSPFFKDLGAIRYVVVMILVLSAVGLPAKMFCRLALPWHLKYIVVTPWFYV